MNDSVYPKQTILPKRYPIRNPATHKILQDVYNEYNITHFRFTDHSSLVAVVT